MNLVAVFVGGGLGAVCRYLAGIGFVRAAGVARPLYLSTFMVNVLGSLLMGLLIGWLARAGGGVNDRWRLFLGVGVLGGFTTFSSFSLEAVLMIERKAYVVAAAYMIGSVALGVLGLMLGLFIMRRTA